jgi:hypothetical protein
VGRVVVIEELGATEDVSFLPPILPWPLILDAINDKIKATSIIGELPVRTSIF